MRAILSCLLLLLFSSPKLILAQANPSWTAPIVPFRIADNLYYVGSPVSYTHLDVYKRQVVDPAGQKAFRIDVLDQSARKHDRARLI